MYLKDRTTTPQIEPENGIITMMRGDSLSFPIKINVGTKLNPEYRGLHENEKLYFGVTQPHQAFEDAVIKKVLDKDSEVDSEGFPILKIEPRDTIKLLVGTYYYCIKLREFDLQGNTTNVKTLKPNTLMYINGGNPKKDDYYVEDIILILDGGVIE